MTVSYSSPFVDLFNFHRFPSANGVITRQLLPFALCSMLSQIHSVCRQRRIRTRTCCPAPDASARPVTAELALLFGRAFEQTPQYWLNLQATYDLKTAEASLGKLLNQVHSLAHA